MGTLPGDRLSCTTGGERDQMDDDGELQEYFELTKIVADFDHRLLTIKGWGVTLSLVALGLGFQLSSYGMFLVAAISSVAFWILEATFKRHQMRYYPRMREIEVHRWERAPQWEKTYSAPRIDWAWSHAAWAFRGEDRSPDGIWARIWSAVWSALLWVLRIKRKQAEDPGDPSMARKSSDARCFNWPWTRPSVFLPHAMTFVVGGALFALGILGQLSGFALGHAK
jgi:hypothetical protein